MDAESSTRKTVSKVVRKANWSLSLVTLACDMREARLAWLGVGEELRGGGLLTGGARPWGLDVAAS